MHSAWPILALCIERFAGLHKECQEQLQVAVYAIGDIQGCYESLRALLDRIDFQSARDRLWFTGDLVNRGPQSLEVLRYIYSLGERAQVVLGNHDLHLLSVWAGPGEIKQGDNLRSVLEAPDSEELMQWLRHQPLLYEEPGSPYVLVHAGILPSWTLGEARSCARELETALKGPDLGDFFRHIYGDRPARWHDSLRGWDRLRFITNAFTRMRYCAADGALLFDYKGAPETAPSGYYPWFAIPDRRFRQQAITVICGHWSTLGLRREAGLLAIDTGCLWGGQLTAARLDGEPQLISMPCRVRMKPGR
ncbi:symmetrical bis(5'-nucleosyl)-tetraphosphatase [Nitrococcus mobilis]|uniref:Bis(5'-nucleosyl)-tetraphosphatase, symmetrical n=1 Tax=Nitrococcus mobilis Nb-231 TaxID=314278 RepID=A4BLW4_9GAMM|nr:bis(5'-nucleosyl)-tetraphosphatase [Nitrococcus mobilis Nb-231]